MTAPSATEAPEILRRGELAERFGVDDEKLLGKAQKLGVLVDLGGERFEAPSPALLRAAEEVLASACARSRSTPSTRPSGWP